MSGGFAVSLVMGRGETPSYAKPTRKLRCVNAALRFEGIDVWRWHAASGQRKALLQGVDWTVLGGEHWVVLGPNGAGKTTLLRIAAARSHPSAGTVEILGSRLGRTPVAALHERIGYVEGRLASRFLPTLEGRELVLTGATGTVALLPERIEPRHHEQAGELLALLVLEHVAERPFRVCSDGERMRLLVARALMSEPELLLLDEPTAGLDLPGRELLLASLRRLAETRPRATTVTVVHHVEDVPPSTTHALLLREGSVVATGPAVTVLADEPLTRCFGVPVRVRRNGARYAAVATTAGTC
jgi:iron complex transport system ATP-binding protein